MRNFNYGRRITNNRIFKLTKMNNENQTPSLNGNPSQGNPETNRQQSEINSHSSIGDFTNIQNKGYKPIENTINPNPPQETGTGKKTE